MRLFTRRRLVAAGFVAAWVVAFAAIGAVSRSSPTAAAPAVGASASAVPTLPWYWTMAVSPRDANVLLLATSSGIYRSGDGGKTWQAVGLKGMHTTSLVQSGDSLFAGGARLAHPNPNPIIRKGSGRTAPDGHALVAVSTDDGKTWRTLHPKGLPDVTVQALAVDPRASDSLYALENDGKLYRSTDGAASFALVSKVGIAPWAIAVTQSGGFVGGDMDAGPFKSANAKKWQSTPFKDAKGGRMVMEYAVQPGTSTNLLMSTVGVVISSDGGKTWQPSLKSDVMFGPVAWAPGEPDVAYALGFDRSLWRTDDGGRKWTQVP
jgi:photosystem II stability/assembly factor-like uncharacterized protein